VETVLERRAIELSPSDLSAAAREWLVDPTGETADPAADFSADHMVKAS
jgi:hypothetical protein